MEGAIVRLGPPPFRSTPLATRHRETRVRPCARAQGFGATRGVARDLLALTLLAASVGASEMAPDVPAAAGLFSERGRGPLASPREDLPRPADLSLVWYDPSSDLEDAFPALADEVRSIFRGLGVEASWRIGGTFGGAAMPEVPVILLRKDPMGHRRSERVLGLVIPDQEPQRAVWVFLESVRLTLGLGRGPLAPTQADALGRALGRVVAHEVIHAIAPDAPHTGDGLMRHALSKDFLLGARAAVDARCASAFVARLAAQWQQARARAAVRSAP